MTSGGAQMTQVEGAFSVALGHVRNATERLLGDDDPSSDSLLLGIAGLELQAMFADVWPAWIPGEHTAAESLESAEDALGEVIDDVPLALWAALRSLRGRVGDGHR